MPHLARAVVALVVLASVAGCFGGVDGVSSGFDDTTDGWRVVGDANGQEARPQVYEERDNDNDYVGARDDVAGGVWYFSAPDAYLGNKSDYYGGRLSFRLWQSKTDSQFQDEDVILRGDGLRLAYDFGDNSSHPGTEWTDYEVPLSPEGWTNLDTGDPATESEFRRVLSDLESLWIRGEYRTGSDLGGLDDVVMSKG